MVLQRYAKKNTRKGIVTKTLTARINPLVYEDFKTYCDHLGLTVSEAVNHLILHELQHADSLEYNYEYRLHTPPTTSVLQKDTPVNTETNTNVNTNVLQHEDILYSSLNTDRFTTKPYERNGNLYCPVCGEWKSAKNFSRHAKEQHNTSTKSIYTNPLYLETIANMLGK